MHARDETDFGPTRRYFRYGLVGMFLLAGAVIVLSFVAALYAPTGGERPWFFGPFWLPFGFLFFLFFLFFIFRWVFRPWRWGWGHPFWGDSYDAMEILRRRYARGEVSREEFERMTRDLEARPR